MWTNDPISDWNRHCEEEENKMTKFPQCEICGEHITEGYRLPDGTIICDDCISDYREEFIYEI